MKLLLALLFFCSNACNAESRLINGTPVVAGTFREVVSLKIGASGCTGTIVGPRAILTAAHCGANGSSAAFEIGEDKYTAILTRSSLYPKQDHDLSLGLVDRAITGVQPASIFKGVVAVGDKIHLLGFGCTASGGGGGNDGILREGDSPLATIAGFDLVTKSGAALCFGDSGGPGFFKARQIGVNSKGNVKDTSYLTNLTMKESLDFFTAWATANTTDVCGITKECTDVVPEEEFDMENLAAKVHVVNKNVHDIDFTKRIFEMVMLYLATGQKMVLPSIGPKPVPPPVPLPKPPELGVDYCSCGGGVYASCDEHNIGHCTEGFKCYCH